MKRWGISFLVVAGILCSQTQVDLSKQARRPDFTSMQTTKPARAGAALPSGCAVGELFFKTGEAGGQTLYACVAENRWEMVSGLGGCRVDSSNNLTCPGELKSGDGSRAGEIALYELPVNGEDFISWLSPDAIPVTYRLRLPAEQPAAGQVLAFSAPSGGIAQGSWTTPSGTAGPPAIDPSYVVLSDEFLPTPALTGNGAFGQLGWQAVSGGVNYVGSTASNPWPGMIELATLGLVNQLAGLHLAGYNFTYPWFRDAAQSSGWEFQFAIKSDVYYTTQHVTRVGLVNSLSQNPTEGIWARVINNTGCTVTGSDTTWKLEAKSGGSGTVVDSGITYATNTHYRIRVRSVQAGQALWSFSVNGGAFSPETPLSFSTTAALAPAFELWGCEGQGRAIVVDRFDAILRR